MSFAVAFGPCVNCRRTFQFNPHKVPSAIVDGEREPICMACVREVNPIREGKGLPPIQVLPDAYEPSDDANPWDDMVP